MNTKNTNQINQLSGKPANRVLGGVLLGLAMVSGVFTLPIQQAWMSGTDLTSQKQEIVADTNQMRAEQGLAALTLNSELTASAQAKADNMADNGYFGHQGPDGNRLAYWLSTEGYSYQLAGENLAEGFGNASDVMAAWKNSPTHFANIVEPRYTEFGVGVAEGEYNGQMTVFVVQHFGEPKIGSRVEGTGSSGKTQAKPVETVQTTTPAKQSTIAAALVPTAEAATINFGSAVGDSVPVVPVSYLVWLLMIELGSLAVACGAGVWFALKDEAWEMKIDLMEAVLLLAVCTGI